MQRQLRGIWLGRRRYAPVNDLQYRLHAGRKYETVDTVLLLEHEPVVTLGRGSRKAHLLAPASILAERGVEVAETDRGGDVTLHAPGQLVAYPIVDLSPNRRDVRRYVRDLTEVMRRLAESYGVAAGNSPAWVGLWADRGAAGSWSGFERARHPAKLGAIGVRISRWIAMHGFAFNLTTDLAWFDLIVPCGIRDYGVTSIEELTGERPLVKDAAGRALALTAEVLDAEVIEFCDHSTHVAWR
ncbi:MAG TPA: lipoyl(octanoyl) transferase LipB [Polyangiaceae bacterium]